MKAESFVLTNSNNVAITYRLTGKNEFNQKDTVLDFVFNYNTFEKPITTALT
jgi:hypothetical protein